MTARRRHEGGDPSVPGAIPGTPVTPERSGGPSAAWCRGR
jgi:hypothetical protein